MNVSYPCCNLLSIGYITKLFLQLIKSSPKVSSLTVNFIWIHCSPWSFHPLPKQMRNVSDIVHSHSLRPLVFLAYNNLLWINTHSSCFVYSQWLTCTCFETPLWSHRASSKDSKCWWAVAAEDMLSHPSWKLLLLDWMQVSESKLHVAVI